MNIMRILCLLLIYVLAKINSASAVLSTQHRLINDLFSSPQYDPRARPVLNFHTPVNVRVKLNLYQLFEVNARMQYVILYVWMTLTWNDNMLKWNAMQYDNITSIVVPYSSIWLPDTYLYNGLQMTRANSENWISAIIQVENTWQKRKPVNHSSVVFRYPAFYKFACNMELMYFPFDSHRCRMIFGSWMFDSTNIVFEPASSQVPKEGYQENEGWQILSLTAKQHFENYSCCPNPFSFVHIDIVLKRRPLHYLIYLFLPILVVSAISNIGLFAPASTDNVRERKIDLGINTLGALSILLMVLVDHMPHSSNSIPLVAQFSFGILIQTAGASLAAIVILFIERQGPSGNKIPIWARRLFFQIIAPILGVNRRRKGPKLPRPIRIKLRKFSLNAYQSVYKVEHDFLEDLASKMSFLHSLIRQRFQRIQTETDDNTLDWEWLASILDRIGLFSSVFYVCMLCGCIWLVGSVRGAIDENDFAERS